RERAGGERRGVRRQSYGPGRQSRGAVGDRRPAGPAGGNLRAVQPQGAVRAHLRGSRRTQRLIVLSCRGGAQDEALRLLERRVDGGGAGFVRKRSPRSTIPSVSRIRTTAKQP